MRKKADKGGKSDNTDDPDKDVITVDVDEMVEPGSPKSPKSSSSSEFGIDDDAPISSFSGFIESVTCGKVRAPKYGVEAQQLRTELLLKMDELERRLREELKGEEQQVEKEVNEHHALSSYLDDEDEDNDPRVYEVNESVWDTFLIAGLHTHGADFFFMLVVGGLNFLIQLTFCLIVHQNMINPPLNESTLLNTALWRMAIGHKADYYDSLTDTSLVTRVCDFSGYSIVAATQSATYTAIKNYAFGSDLDDVRDILGYLTPPLLCLIVLMIWSLNIIGEILSTLDMFRALSSIPIARESKILVEEDGESLTFSSISPWRLFVMQVCVVIPKFAIACALGYMGTLYLVYTPSPGDLILNALALQCVQDMDEFLYEHLMPMRIRKRLMAVSPLEISPRARMPYRVRSVVSARALGTFILLIGSLFVSANTLLLHEIDMAGETKRLLCGGNTNFIYSQDAATGLVSTADTSLQFSFDDMFKTYAFRAVLQKTGLDLTGTLDLQERTGRGILGSYHGMEQRRLEDAQSVVFDLFSTTTTNKVSEMNIESFIQANDHLACSDIVNNQTNPDSVNESMYAAFQNTFPEGTCSDIVRDCNSATARSYCPATCGCNVHISGMFNRDGCTEACNVMVDTQFSRDITAATSVSGACEDRATFSTEFKRYFSELQVELISQGKLVVRQLPFGPPVPPQGEDFVWLSDELLVLYAFSTGFRYWLHANISIDLGNLANVSYTHTVNLPNHTYSPCKFIEVVYKIFDFDACDPDKNTLAGKAGNLRSICPKTCGYCTDPVNTDYQDQNWDSLYDWMLVIMTSAGTPTDTLIQPVSFQSTCELYSWYHPEFDRQFMHFCTTDVGLLDGFPGWYSSMKVVFPELDVLAMVSDPNAVALPSSTTTSTTTSTLTSSTSTTSTSTTSKSTTTTTITTKTTTITNPLGIIR